MPSGRLVATQKALQGFAGHGADDKRPSPKHWRILAFTLFVAMAPGQPRSSDELPGRDSRWKKLQMDARIKTDTSIQYSERNTDEKKRKKQIGERATRLGTAKQVKRHCTAPLQVPGSKFQKLS
jgi:hypothetical protein